MGPISRSVSLLVVSAVDVLEAEEVEELVSDGLAVAVVLAGDARVGNVVVG